MTAATSLDALTFCERSVDLRLCVQGTYTSISTSAKYSPWNISRIEPDNDDTMTVDALEHQECAEISLKIVVVGGSIAGECEDLKMGLENHNKCYDQGLQWHTY